MPDDNGEVSALEQAQLEEALQLSLALEESLKQQPAQPYSAFAESAVDIDAFGVRSNPTNHLSKSVWAGSWRSQHDLTLEHSPCQDGQGAPASIKLAALSQRGRF